MSKETVADIRNRMAQHGFEREPYSPDQIAEAYGRHYQTVAKLIREGCIPAVKCGKYYEVSAKGILAWRKSASS